MTKAHFAENLILGLDLGTNSIGWALLDAPGGKPERIIRAGVRVFEAGVNLNEKGEKSSKNYDRRQARGRRRLLHRRRRRMDRALHELQRAGLLPKGQLKDNASSNDPEWKLVLELDPYELRRRALDERMEPFELGRALYHLGKRRGFLTNRKSEPKKDEEDGVVKEKTGELEREMQSTGARTWGEFLACLNPHERRRRGQYTLRRWYQEEFDAIWKSQAVYHTDRLTEERRKSLEKAIFHQRPLKNQSHLIGRCELESRNGRRRARAPRATLAAQRYRLLEMVNHSRLVAMSGEERPLSPEGRLALIGVLEQEGDVSMAKARKLVGAPKGWQFNHENGGKKFFFGNRTASKLREIFGERWDAMTAPERDIVVEDVLTFEKADALEKRALRPYEKDGERVKGWGLDPEAAKALSALKLEPDFAKYSRQALEKLLPHLEEGKAHTQALQAAYPERETRVAAVDLLPPLEDLRNPIVQRTLAEVRRVVNAIIKQYGKPGTIRIELARDLKNPRSVREEIQSEISARENERTKAAARVTELTGNPHPSRDDIEKYLLWEECRQQCPYTGRMIGQQDLFGEHPQVDVEHIIPFSRSLDNSFGNKTLCYAAENRERKRNHTPWEAYKPTEGDSESRKRWDEIVSRVKQFRSRQRSGKLRRFLATEVELEEDFFKHFTERQLNDTRYASKRAAEYLAKLYGAPWREHIQVNQGRATAFLRGVWDLNGILNGDGIKTRDDHRHHAVDALCVALTSHGAVRMLAEASKRGKKEGQFGKVDLPWPGFVDEARAAVLGIIVSHRISRKVNGPLHNETHYGLIKPHRGATEPVAVVKKAIGSLTKPEIANGEIVDGAVRRAVHRKLEELGGDLKAFKRPGNHPVLVGRNGSRTPIFRVRVKQQVSPESIAGGAHQRHVKTGGNHHLAIYEDKDRKDSPVWRGEVVSRLKAARRLRRGEPAIASRNSDGNPLVLSLVIGDAVELDWEGERRLLVVQNLSGSPKADYVFKHHWDSRLAKDRKHDSLRVSSDKVLMTLNCTKVSVTPLGDVRPWGG